MANSDTFSQSGADIKINKTKSIITSKSTTYNTAYGSAMIDASKYKVYAWTFKILKLAPNGSINIGITEASTPCIDANFARSKTHSNAPHFSYCSWGKKYSYNDEGEKYLKRYGENDLVSMKLDFDSSTGYGSLYFDTEKITDNTVQYAFDTRKPYKIAFNQIMKTYKYKMAVSLKNASVESFDFIKKWPSISSIPSKSDIIERDIPSILKSTKNGDKRSKQKKRVRFMFDKDNENDGDDVVDEEPLKKKRRMNKKEEDEDDIEILNDKKKYHKLSLQDKIHGVYKENRVLIKKNKRLNDKCNEYEDKYRKYEKEKKQILERLKEHEMKIKELEISNDKYQDIMTKMISIIGREDDKNEDMNGNKCDNTPKVVVMDENNDDMDISNSDDEYTVDIKNKTMDKGNGDLDICTFCQKKANQIFYCVECRNVNCNNNECKLQHQNIHKNEQKERRKEDMNNNHNVGNINNMNNRHSMINAMGTTNNIFNMNYLPNMMSYNPMQQLLIPRATMPYNTMQRVGTMPTRYPMSGIMPKPLRNANNLILGGNIGNPIVLDTMQSNNK